MYRVLIAMLFAASIFVGCRQTADPVATEVQPADSLSPDTHDIPSGPMGEMIRYGRDLMLHTAYWIGPSGKAGHYTGNRMNCTNCHQQAGTKPHAFNLMEAHRRYPQYRAREGRVLTLADRINNCVTRPHNGVPIPVQAKEMVALLSYLKWIGEYPPPIPEPSADSILSWILPQHGEPELGSQVYAAQCERCHGHNGEGELEPDGIAFKYPPLWGNQAYQAGSSMHRVIMEGVWIYHNMPHDLVKAGKPYLTIREALDVASFINNDQVHKRPKPIAIDYPQFEEKAIDYATGPFADTFPASVHQYGPWTGIYEFRKSHGLKSTY